MESTCKPLRGLTILAVDDSPEITSLVGEVLIDAGATVVLANSGRNGLCLSSFVRLDVMILDVGMPQLDGLTMIEYFSKARTDLLRRTLVLTGRTFDRPLMARLEELEVPVIVKPFQLDELIAAVSRRATCQLKRFAV